MSGQFRGNLKPAHRGYQYQDLLTAFVLAESLLRKYEKVIVDKKIVDGDCFDDLEVQFGRLRKRIQIKSSEKDKRPLKGNDFTNKASSIRIDHLVKSYINTRKSPSDEYRLCATWDPTDDEELENLLIAVPNASPKIVKTKTEIFQFDINLLWPEDKEPLWRWLKEGSFQRGQVAEFCTHFFIELNLPRATRNLLEPGELENRLIQLLANRIGIGRYPNHGREPHDVAALLIAVANSARSDSQTLEPTRIEHLLNLQTDFGCLSQEFPVNPETFQDRDSLRSKLIELVLRGNHIILTGPPGIGKSWELTELVADLREKGALVAYHYCYLNPGDQYIEQRITSNVLFGNLQAELVNSEPSLRSKTTAYYSSGLREFEELLYHADQLDTPIVLIIDGLDHISRVLADAHSISHLEADIIDHLATLKVPESVSIVLGSQPGNHLHPLEKKLADRLGNVNALPWSNADIIELARSLKTERVLLRHKFDSEYALEQLAVKSEGSPLFATYLARQLCIAIENGAVTEVGEWFKQIPPIEGDIETYYSYLYKSSINTAQAIADLLGVMDFAVTKDELKNILPPINHRWLEPALQHLEPVLTEVTLQGGIRIFHESFRRFMNRELSRQGHSLTDVLQPVINWLQNAGFFEDTKAYRFLLPLLQRSDQVDTALELIQADFVAKSVANGHPYEAVERNLLVAASIAGRHSRWVEIIRCAELIRAAYTCYEDKLHDPVLYWETFLHLFGPNALVRSLLFEGKITQKEEIGLLLCSMADDAGAAPPWQEYLAAYQQMDKDQEDRSEDSRFPFQVSLARIHGVIRTKGFDDINQSIHKFLLEHGPGHPHPEYIRDLGATITKVASVQAVEQLIACKDKHIALDKEIIALLQLGAAKASAQAHDYELAAKLADQALPNLTSSIFTIECIELGAKTDKVSQSIASPSTVELYLNSYPDENADSNVREWWASLRLLSCDDLSILEQERNRIKGEGWYRCWLSFILILVESEQAFKMGKTSPTICKAFDALTVDMRPFAGKPRACDLYQLRHLIGDTLEWGLSLLDSSEDWQYALNIIQLVRDNISTSLDSEPSGPIYTSTILNILQRSITRPDLVPIIKTYIEKEIAKDDARGTYFEFHAEHNMRYASVVMSIGDVANATKLWHQICIYLSSYGFRKDITLYEITESIPALLNKDKQDAFKALVMTQPLTEIVINHTDGRNTKHAPLNWFGNLLECDLSIGLSLLSQSLAKPYASVGWRIEDALSKALYYCADVSDPILADILCDILPFHIDYESECSGTVKLDTLLSSQ